MKIALFDHATLFHADCRDAIRSLPDNSVDAVVTDPPYEIGFMGKAWDNRGIANDVGLWSEVLRVLKPGGHVAAFGASRGYHRMACAIEDAGFEIRDSLMWVYGTGFPKSHDVSKGIDASLGAKREKGPVDPVRFARLKNQLEGYTSTGEQWEHGGRTVTIDPPATPQAAEWEGWGTALKPAFEPIVLARKPLSEGTVAANVLRWGTGALNIDGCRVDGGERVAKAGGMARKASPVYGAYAGVDAPDSVTTEGRWPANVVHDGSDEVVGAFPNTAPAKAGKPRQGKSGDGYGMTHTGAEYNDNGGSAARFFYSAKASKADRNGSKHPTVKPIALMEWLATLITPPGGTILDPFGGSGTTCAAARNKGFSVILCEREAEYVEDLKRRFDAPTLVPLATARFRAFDALKEILGERARVVNG